MFRGFSCIFLVRPCCPFYQNESFHLQAGAPVMDDAVMDDGEKSPAGPYFLEFLCHSGPAPVCSSVLPARPPLLLLGPGGDYARPFDIQIR
jgi:hypothetical protein